MTHLPPETLDQDRNGTPTLNARQHSRRQPDPRPGMRRGETTPFFRRLEAAHLDRFLAPFKQIPDALAGTTTAPAQTAAHLPLELRIHHTFTHVTKEWREFQTIAVSTPFQRHEWVSLWCDMIGEARGVKPMLIFGYDRAGILRLILPLGIQTGRFVKRLIWLGEGINDYNAPMIDPAFAATLSKSDATRIWWHAMAAAGGADLADLGRQPEKIGTVANPFAHLWNGREGYSAHSVSLGKDWETFYADKRSSKTRQRARAKQRKFEAMGEVEFVWAESAEERSALMREIVNLKRRQLRDAGDRDPFGAAPVQAFLDHAARLRPEQSTLRLAALKLDGVAVAAVFGLIDKHTFHYVIPVFRTGAYSKFSPGNILLHKLMAWSIDQGLTAFDFTIGDEQYKTEWTEHTQKLGIALYPLSVKGYLAAALTRLARAAKAAIKAHPPLARRVIACERLLRDRMG